MSFYSVIAGWGMSYVLMSLSGFYQNLSSAEISDVFEKLSHSGSITVFWHFLFTLITMSIVLTGVRKGSENLPRRKPKVSRVKLVFPGLAGP